MEYFTPDFLRLLAQMSKFAFCVAGFITFVVLLIKPSVSGIYLKYPYFLRPLSLIWFCNSWDISYVFFLVIIILFPSSHRRCSVKKGVLRSFAKFKEKTCARVSFLTKLQAWGLFSRTLLEDCFCLFRFTCGKEKLCQNVKKLTNVLSKTVVPSAILSTNNSWNACPMLFSIANLFKVLNNKELLTILWCFINNNC